MPLNNTLITEFAKSTKTKQNKKQETIVYGTLITKYGYKYLKIDGADDDSLIPISLITAEVNENERVIAMIKNHSAVITGNMSNQSVSSSYVDSAIQNANINSIELEYIENLWKNNK